MKKARIIAGLSAAVIALSMAAVPVQAADVDVQNTVVMGASASYDKLDVVEAFRNAGIDSLNVNNLRNFLILNDDYFDSSDYADFIDCINQIRDLYFAPMAYALFYKTPDQLTENDRYRVYDSFSNAEKNAILNYLINVAEDHHVLVTVDTDTMGYPVFYGSMRNTAKKKSKNSGSSGSSSGSWGIDGGSSSGSSSSSSSKKNIANADIYLSATKLIYTGSARKPSVLVKMGSKKLTKGKDYTLSYKNCIEPGRAAVIVKGKGNYKGSETVYYYIAPRKISIRSLSSPAKYKIKAVWQREPKASGYNLQISANSSFSSPVKDLYIKSNTATSKTVSGLTSGRKYFVRVRAYKQITGRKVCGKFSAVKRVTVK